VCCFVIAAGLEVDVPPLKKIPVDERDAAAASISAIVLATCTELSPSESARDCGTPSEPTIAWQGTPVCPARRVTSATTFPAQLC
jgi:hypothetical protein